MLVFNFSYSYRPTLGSEQSGHVKVKVPTLGSEQSGHVKVKVYLKMLIL